MQVEFRSHFAGKKSVSYGPGNMVSSLELLNYYTVSRFIWW